MEMETGYSKLRSIELTNFMGFVKAKAVFDESGSLNFKGYNSSGKSAFLTACAVAMMNAFPNKQAKYIRHNQDYFRIILRFDDGVVIVRDKYKNGQSLYEMYKDEKKIYTSKMGDKYLRIDAVPEEIENYLGMIGTELGYLNYQVRRDPLWLVETKGSDNYYTLNEVLKSVEIAQANALLNTDKNALNGEITVVESEINTLNGQLLGMVSGGEALLGRLYDRQRCVEGLFRRYDRVRGIGELASRVVECEKEVVPEIVKVREGRYAEITGLGALVDRLADLSGSYFGEELLAVEVRRYEGVKGISEKVGSVSKSDYFEAEVGNVGGADELKGLEGIMSVVEKLRAGVSELKKLNSEFSVLENERDTLISEAKSKGIQFTICSNCGTMLEVGMEA